MKFEIHSHRNALQIVKQIPEYKSLWSEIEQSLTSISDQRIREHFESNYQDKGKATKSISKSINELISKELISRQWTPEARIFSDPIYSQTRSSSKWRLDFAKQLKSEPDFHNELEPEIGISIEVAFNHDGTTAWNLLKPVLAGELNHVEKDIQTGLAVVITATEALKKVGGFDNAIGTFETYKLHLKPMRNILTIPMLLIGLSPTEDFHISVKDRAGGKQGFIVDSE